MMFQAAPKPSPAASPRLPSIPAADTAIGNAMADGQAVVFDNAQSEACTF